MFASAPLEWFVFQPREVPHIYPHLKQKVGMFEFVQKLGTWTM